MTSTSAIPVQCSTTKTTELSRQRGAVDLGEGEGEGGGELPYKKDEGACWKLKKTRKMYQDPVFWAWLELFFTPKRF